MYEEDKISISWFKIALRLVIILLIILLSLKLITIVLNNSTNVKETNEMHESLKVMNKVAREYFKGDNLPVNVGENKKVLLKDLIEEKKIEEIKDTKGKVCDNEKSYIKVTRLDKQYQVKSNLVCGDKEDYYNSFIDIEEKQTLGVEGTTTEKTTTTKKTSPILDTTTTTTKKVETTKVTEPTTTVKTTKKVVVKKKFMVSFNSNGGNYIDTQAVTENGTINNVTPVREGYTFVGWYYHGAKFNVATKINQDYVLTAKWVLN